MKHTILFILCLSAKILLAQDIVFRTSVENMRLREQPNLESKVIKMIPKGTWLKWSGIRTEKKITADWKGEKVADYWYKVKTNQDTTAWVFGKGIYFDGFIGDENVQNIDNEWIRLEKSSEFDFSKIPITKTIWKPNLKKQTTEGIHDDFILKYSNGTSKKFKNDSDEFGVDFEGEIPELGLYFLSYFSPCCGGTSIVYKKNGKEISTPAINFHGGKAWFPSDKNAIPIFSKDKKTAIFTNGCEPDSDYGVGIYDFKNDKTLNSFFWYNIYFDDFRFITNRSGIAKLRDNTYWKIRLK